MAVEASLLLEILALILTVELAQLGVLLENRSRSIANRDRIDSLLISLGLDPEDAPEYNIDLEDLIDNAHSRQSD